jgi:Flp pilus assembly secretin CpaC
LVEVSSVAPEVLVAGVPSFRTRRAETDVQVKDGQTIVIGGLLNNQHDRDAIRKVPWLGDIPGLGVLFRSKDYQANLSELLVFVTPEVVKDIDADAANAAQTPELQDWHGHQADEQLRTRQDEPYPKWQKPLEVDEFKPAIRPPETAPEMEGEPAAEPAAPGEAAAPGEGGQNFEPARPAAP